MNLSWIDRLRSRIPWRDPFITGITAFAFALLVYLVAAIPLLVSGQGYLAKQPPLVLGGIGIWWSLFVYWIGSYNYRAHLESVKTALKEEEREPYGDKVEKHLDRLDNNRIYFIVSLAAVVIIVIFTGAEMYGAIPRRILRVFPPEWSSPSLWGWRLASIGILGVPVMLLLWSLGWLLTLHTIFLSRIILLEYLPSQYIFFLRLKPLLWINIIGAAGWSIGVALFALLFSTRYGLLQFSWHLIWLVVLQAVATYAFFKPTWLFHEKSKEMGRIRIDKLVVAAQDKVELSGTDPSSWSSVFLLEEQLAKYTTVFSLTLGWKFVGYVLTTFVLPIATAIIATVLTNYLNPPK